MKGTNHMKYSEYHSKSKFKGSAAFYIIIACCLLAIGGASWFAAANISGRNSKNESSSGNQSDTSSFSSSKIESKPDISSSGISENVEKHVSDVPYSSAESTSSAETKEKTSVRTYSMPIQGEVIKNYSEKELQYSATYGDMRLHSGIDIACEDGTAVSACANGTVLSVENSSEFGCVVTIDHGDGITAKYAAIKGVKVKAGDKISAGDIIGNVTTVPCECADQSHLHLEVYKNGHAAPPLATLKLD